MGHHPRDAAVIDGYIERQGKTLRTEMRKPFLYLLDLRDRRTPDHRAADPGVQHLCECRGVAQAAADLQIERPSCREIYDDCAIAERPIACTIQIDDVQPVGARLLQNFLSL